MGALRFRLGDSYPFDLQAERATLKTTQKF